MLPWVVYNSTSGLSRGYHVPGHRNYSQQCSKQHDYARKQLLFGVPEDVVSYLYGSSIGGCNPLNTRYDTLGLEAVCCCCIVPVSTGVSRGRTRDETPRSTATPCPPIPKPDTSKWSFPWSSHEVSTTH